MITQDQERVEQFAKELLQLARQENAEVMALFRQLVFTENTITVTERTYEEGKEMLAHLQLTVSHLMKIQNQLQKEQEFIDHQIQKYVL